MTPPTAAVRVDQALRANRRQYFQSEEARRTELQDEYTKPSPKEIRQRLPMVDFFGITVEPQPLVNKFIWNCPEAESVMRYRQHHPWGCLVS